MLRSFIVVGAGARCLEAGPGCGDFGIADLFVVGRAGGFVDTGEDTGRSWGLGGDEGGEGEESNSEDVELVHVDFVVWLYGKFCDFEG